MAVSSKKRVVAAMSGGVDSSLAAALLLEEGYDVIGITMQIWPASQTDPDREGGCCSLSAVEDARSVANRLGIPYYVVNFQDIFEREVIHNFCSEYRIGRTPNPCIRCNMLVKFDALLRKAKELDAEYVATGHYARIEYDTSLGRYLLYKAEDLTKDQTYALYQLKQDQLRHILFPLGRYTKKETRRRAEELGLTRVARKPESQEICFVPDNDYRSFLKEYSPSSVNPGPIVDLSGRVLGEHQGISFYTIGQRKGLGIVDPEPYYVVDLDPSRNAVVVGRSRDLMAKGLKAVGLNFIPFDTLTRPMDVEAKIRYNTKPSPCRIEITGADEVTVSFEEAQRAITPGQAVVFYQDGLVIGGGTIDRVLRE